jgi:hypothetical protein
MRFFLLYVDITYPSGGPISPHLLRYRAFAVKNHSRIPCASHPTTYILNNIVVASGAWQSGKLDP